MSSEKTENNSHKKDLNAILAQAKNAYSLLFSTRQKGGGKVELERGLPTLGL